MQMALCRDEPGVYQLRSLQGLTSANAVCSSAAECPQADVVRPEEGQRWIGTDQLSQRGPNMNYFC